MPQKKNPDVAELARGKTGRVNGHLVALLTLMKGQPLAYNRDNQEDKEPLFDTVDTLADTLAIMTDLVAGGIVVNAERMREAAAEGHADRHRPRRLSGAQGRAVSRRARSRRPGRAPRGSSAASRSARLPLAELQSFAPEIGADVHAVLTLEGSVASRNHPGGTAPDQVRAAIAAARRALDLPPADAHANLTTKELETDGNTERGISRAGRHGLSDGRTSRAGRAPGHRLQPLGGQGLALGRRISRQERAHTGRGGARMPISC